MMFSATFPKEIQVTPESVLFQHLTLLLSSDAGAGLLEGLCFPRCRPCRLHQREHHPEGAVSKYLKQYWELWNLCFTGGLGGGT